jgi:hypothetical protein
MWSTSSNTRRGVSSLFLKVRIFLWWKWWSDAKKMFDIALNKKIPE